MQYNLPKENNDKMKLNFRKAIISDYNDIIRLKKQVHEFHCDNRPDFYKKCDMPISKKEFEDILKSQDQEIYVIESEEKLCGYSFIKTLKFADNPLIIDHNRLYVDDICIDKRLRKKGIGRALMKELELLCKSRGYKYMDLNVWNFNSEARDFYIKCGMKEIMYRMEKQIDK